MNEQPDTTQLVARDNRNCATCGKPHNAYRVKGNPKRWGTWADPKDGHTYRPIGPPRTPTYV